MDGPVFLERVKETRTFARIPMGRERVIFMDNAGGHKLKDEVKEVLRQLNTEVCFLPKKQQICANLRIVLLLKR